MSPPTTAPALLSAAELSETQAAQGLGEGSLLVWKPQELSLPRADELAFLGEVLAPAMRLKNVSYHPHEKFLTGARLGGMSRRRAIQVLLEHHGRVVAALRAVMPGAMGEAVSGKVNYRPLQERGRQLSRRSSNELVHVDAFASGATFGARVLRVFTNIHPHEPRVWRSAGRFDVLWARFAEEAGLLGDVPLREAPWDKPYDLLCRGVASLGPSRAVFARTSPYDRLMRRFHNFLKEHDRFQEEARGLPTFSLPPGHTWAVLTDAVSHAVVSGQGALVCTFHLPRHVCGDPALAPWNVIQTRTPGQPAVSPRPMVRPGEGVASSP